MRLVVSPKFAFFSSSFLSSQLCIHILEVKGHLSASRESLLSPASPASNGGIYSVRFLIFFVAIFTIDV